MKLPGPVPVVTKGGSEDTHQCPTPETPLVPGERVEYLEEEDVCVIVYDTTFGLNESLSKIVSSLPENVTN